MLAIVPDSAKAGLLGPYFNITNVAQDSDSIFDVAAGEGEAQFLWTYGDKGEILTRSLSGSSLGFQEGPIGYTDAPRVNLITSDGRPRITQNREGVLAAWQTWEGPLVTAWKPSGAPQFRSNRPGLCEPTGPQEGGGPGIGRCELKGLTTSPAGSIVAWWVEVSPGNFDRLMIGEFDPTKETWTRDVVATRTNRIPSAEVSVGSTGEITVVWNEYQAGGSALLAATRLLEGAPFSQPQVILERLDSGGLCPQDYSVATSDLAAMVIVAPATVNGYDSCGKSVPFFVRQSGGEGFSSRREIEFPKALFELEVAAQDPGRFILGGLMERKGCSAHPVARIVSVTGDQIVARNPVWLLPDRRVCDKYSGWRPGDFVGNSGLSSSWRDGTVVAHWDREKDLPDSPNLYRDGLSEAAVLARNQGSFSPAIALGPPAPYNFQTSAVSVSSKSSIYAIGLSTPRISWWVDKLVGLGCSGSGCSPGARFELKLRKPTGSAKRVTVNGIPFLRYFLSVRNIGNTRAFKVKTRSATKLVGRQRGWSRWSRWKTRGTGSIETGFLTRSLQLLPVPPRGRPYLVKFQVRAKGAPKASVVLKVKR